jgi:flagellar protein FlaG
MEIANTVQSQIPTGTKSDAISSNSGTSVAPSSTAASVVNLSNSAQFSAPKQAPIEQQLKQAFSDLDLPDMPIDNYRVELNFSRDTGRVIAKVTDRTNGEVLREIPSKELQHLFSNIREYLGTFVDEKA